MTFGEKLQRLRQQKGLSQDALSEMLGVTRQAVSKWERDETMPEVEKVLRISEIFEVSLDVLLKDTPQPERPADKKQDWGKQLSHLIETKWYYLGLVLALWGILNLIQILPVLLGMGFLDGIFPGVSLLVLITPAVKIGGGLILYFWGRSYAEQKEREK